MILPLISYFRRSSQIFPITPSGVETIIMSEEAARSDRTVKALDDVISAAEIAEFILRLM